MQRAPALSVAAAVLMAGAALSSCGFKLGDDPEMEEALDWVRGFKADNPQVAREIGQQCKQELTANPYLTREGSLQLFKCIRTKAEAQGY